MPAGRSDQAHLDPIITHIPIIRQKIGASIRLDPPCLLKCHSQLLYTRRAWLIYCEYGEISAVLKPGLCSFTVLPDLPGLRSSPVLPQSRQDRSRRSSSMYSSESGHRSHNHASFLLQNSSSGVPGCYLRRVLFKHRKPAAIGVSHLFGIHSPHFCRTMCKTRPPQSDCSPRGGLAISSSSTTHRQRAA